jgi:hypothetical protein
VTTTSPPTVYKESTGTSSYAGSSVSTDSTNGILPPTYLEEHFFDVIVTDNDSIFADRLFIDQISGHTQQPRDVRDYHSIQDAIDAAQAGESVYIPSGEYDLPSGGLKINKKLTLFGDGIGPDETDPGGTILRPNSNNDHAIVLEDHADTDDVTIRSLRIQGDAQDGTGDGIHAVITTADRRPATIILENLFITGMGNHGLNFEQIDFPTFRDVDINGCQGYGIRMDDIAQARFEQVYSHGNESFGLHASGCVGIYFQGIGIEDNQESSSSEVGEFKLLTCHSVLIERTDFEGFGRSTGKNNTAIWLEGCRGVRIHSNDFVNATEDIQRAIYIHNNCQGIEIGPNRMRNVAVGIEENTSQADPSDGIVIQPQAFMGTVTTPYKGILPRTQWFNDIVTWNDWSGTLAVTKTGTYPTTMHQRMAFPYTAKNGQGFSTMVPGDWIPGTDIEIYLTCYVDMGMPLIDRDIISKFYYLAVKIGEDFAGSKTTINKTISVEGATGDGDINNNNQRYDVHLGTISGSALEYNDWIEAAFERDGTDQDDTFDFDLFVKGMKFRLSRSTVFDASGGDSDHVIWCGIERPPQRA